MRLSLQGVQLTLNEGGVQVNLRHTTFLASGTCLLVAMGWFLNADDARTEARQYAPPVADPVPPKGPVDGPLAAYAGNYYFGDGTGVNCSLSLTADGRFSFRWRGCLGLYDQNQGAAGFRNGHLVLKPERPNARGGFRGTPTEFVPVPWGQRMYLVPGEDREEFCNSVNGGQEPRRWAHGQVYLRDGDWTKPVTGHPTVPKEWEPMLLKRPIRAKVVDVLADGRARVDAGTADGVWKEMELWADVRTFGLVKVVEADEHSCVIAPKYVDLDKLIFTKNIGVHSRLGDED